MVANNGFCRFCHGTSTSHRHKPDPQVVAGVGPVVPAVPRNLLLPLTLLAAPPSVLQPWLSQTRSFSIRTTMLPSRYPRLQVCLPCLSPLT
jgi:hypothetical protein